MIGVHLTIVTCICVLTRVVAKVIDVQMLNFGIIYLLKER
jgi:hypothetical protein